METGTVNRFKAPAGPFRQGGLFGGRKADGFLPAEAPGSDRFAGRLGGKHRHNRLLRVQILPGYPVRRPPPSPFHGLHIIHGAIAGLPAPGHWTTSWPVRLPSPFDIPPAPPQVSWRLPPGRRENPWPPGPAGRLPHLLEQGLGVAVLGKGRQDYAQARLRQGVQRS